MENLRGYNKYIKELSMNTNNWFSARTLKTKWMVIAFALGAIVVAISLSVIFSVSGEAGGKKSEEELGQMALSSSKEFMPEAKTARMMQDYSSSNRITYEISDGGDNTLVVLVDRVTGNIDGMLDFREESKSAISANINIDSDKARNIAEDFLNSNGVDISQYGLEKDPLRVVGYGKSIEDVSYRYEFYYRLQKDGIFIDDWESGGGYCSVNISPETGEISTFLLPRATPSLVDRAPQEIKIGSAQAIDIVIDEVSNMVSRDVAIPKFEKEAELRYMTIPGNELLPYWRIEYGLEPVDYGKYPGAGLTILGISAVDGSIVLRYE
jgi:hypothetical protein